MSAGRVAALGALVIAVGLVAFLLLSGGKTHEYKLVFQNAGQLVNGDDVQVGGRRIGSIKKIELTKDQQAQVTITVDDGYAPLHEGTTATVRATSLSGIANRYIALAPGPNNAGKLDDDATLRTDRTTSIVDLDQLFDTLNPETRAALQRVIKGSAVQYAGSQDASKLSPTATSKAKAAAAQSAILQQKVLKYLNPGLSTTQAVVQEVTRDTPSLTQLLVNGARLTNAIVERRSDLSALVGNADVTLGAIANENASFSRTLQLLPGTLRHANTTFVNLRATLDDLDRLTDASKPATKNLARFLRELRPLVSDALPTIHDLRVLIRQAGPNNDLIDAIRKLVPLEAAARPALADTTKALRDGQSTIEFIRPYLPELVGWFRDFGVGTANYDANGHFARISPQFNAFSFTDNPAGGTLTPVAASLREAGFGSLRNGLGNLRRCPGTASQVRPPLDDSALYRSSPPVDCDPSQVLPGSPNAP